MKKIRAILFDMDGVLVDAKDWHYEALNRALELFGLSITRYDHLATFDGLPTKVKLKMISNRFFLPESLHNFINQLKQSYTIQYIHEKCHPLFHHEYALSKLHQEGYKIAVCSNSIRRTIELMMEKSCLSLYLDLIISNEDVVKAKPDPEMYVKGIENFGLEPRECIVVEDNPNGIQAGKASGAYVMEVADVFDVTYANIKRFVEVCEND